MLTAGILHYRACNSEELNEGMNMAENNLGSVSHKGEKVRSFSAALKLEVIRYAEVNSNHAASRKYKIDRNSIRDWRRKREKIEKLIKDTSSGAKRKRLDGGGRRVTDEEIEENLLEWIFDRRDKGLRVSRKLITIKAKKFQEEKQKDDPNIKTLVFSAGWLTQFMKRNGLSIRRRTTQTQKTPDQLIDKLSAYILKLRRLRKRMNYELKNIIAMDETAIWNDMISNTTVEKRGAHSVNMKTTGHEKSKITVCLTATADGTKKKPFFVSRGAKRDVKRLNEEYKGKCIVASSASGWMDEPLTEQYCREVIGTFTFGSRRLLAWDSFSCHLTPRVKELLNKGKVDPVIVPGGCTKYIQAPDVSWNKPMKEYLREKYDTWLAEEDHELTAQGNMRGPSRQQMIEWVLDAWRKLPEDIIKKSFKVCALSTSLDGAEDAEIMCIKHGPCQNLLQRLQASQLDDEDDDPFDAQISEEDMFEEEVPYLTLDEDDDILDILE